MDEIVDNVDVSSMATGAISGFAEVVLWLAVIIGVLGVIGLGWFFLSFKHKVRVRQVLNDGTSRIIDDKARFSKDKHGVGWWKLRKLNMKVAEPPSQVKES